VAGGRVFNELRMGPGSEGNVACPRCADAISGRPVIQKVCFFFISLVHSLLMVAMCVFLFVWFLPLSHLMLVWCEEYIRCFIC
jgi:hypothetical protein